MHYHVLGILLPVLTAGPAPAAPKAATPAKLPPLISTTARDAECEAAELRLARFIRALQLERREDAAQFFSTKVTPEERQSFMQGQWPSRQPGKANDMSSVLFLPDLQIRTRNRYENALRMDVASRKKAKKKLPRGLGYLSVTMRRENEEWRLDLHPLKADVPVRVSHPAKEHRDKLKSEKLKSEK